MSNENDLTSGEVVEDTQSAKPQPITMEVPAPQEVPTTDGMETESEKDSGEVTPTVPLIRRKQNVNVRLDIFKPTLLKGHGSIPMLRVSASEFDTQTNSYPELASREGSENSPEVREWLPQVNNALSNALLSDPYKECLYREGSMWEDSVVYEGKTLIAKKTSPSVKGESGAINNMSAIDMLRRELADGTGVTIPLWHSGIWVRLSAPTSAELYNLERKILSEKISMGKNTNGAVFSNLSVYVVQHLFDFIIDHITATTIADGNPEKYRQVIRTPDLPILAWGMACTIYPAGFNYSQVCTANPLQCTEVTTDLIQLGLLQKTDTGMLLPEQKQHMAKCQMVGSTSSYRASVEEILAYQSKGIIGNTRQVQIHTDNDSVLNVDLKIPTIQEYIKAGLAWYNDIAAAMVDTFGETMDERSKQETLVDYASLSTLRMYAHWMERIHYSNGSFTDSPDILAKLLDALSADNAASTQLVEEITKYIDSVTVSLIAVPSFPCPSCKQPISTPDHLLPSENFQHLIIVDAIKLFFTLRDLRISKIQA